ncbi:MAG: hypothetical protein WD118_08425 [Phycisphaeraceae bacterium]
MADRIFLRSDRGELIPLEARAFASESELDGLLADYPRLLASALSTDDRPLRFLLVEVQAAIDDGDGGRRGRWSADLLFLDSEGMLTIVEDKLSNNPDIRRAVLGQAIEYAANLYGSLTVDGLRERLANRTDEVGAEIATLIEDDEEGAEAGFWQRVENNLRAGAMRLVFAADRLPRELRLAIEFLNQVTQPLEVVGVEVRQLGTGSGPDAPNVVLASAVGLTERKRKATGTGGGASSWEFIEAEEFFRGLEQLNDHSRCARAGAHLARELLKSDLFEPEIYRTAKAGEVLRFNRVRDGRGILNIRANRRQKKCTVGAPVMRQKWPDSLRRSLDQLIGEPVGGLGGLNDWLNQDEAHGQQLLEWLLREGAT